MNAPSSKIRARTVSALALCLLLGQTLCAQAHTQDALELGGRAAEMVLQSGEDRHFRASGAINGHAVDFLVDTGASLVTIPGHLAAKLGLSRGQKVQTTSASDVFESETTTVRELSIGGIRLQNVAGLINPKATDNEILLGMSALKDLEMVQKDGTLALRGASGLALQVVAVQEENLRIKSHVRDCMGPGKLIDRKALECMKGQ
jgi:aspartyl protease family protein